jgi:ABC-type antimicrobial peptide transport system permease subunit
MPCTIVIGVAENAVHDPVADLPLRYYLPEAQAQFGPPTLLLRMRGDPATAADDVRRSLQAAMPGLSMVTVRRAAEVFEAKRRSWRIGATMLLGLGALALLVAAVGVYGVVAYMVTQRMHDLGVRVALGARSPDIMRLVLGQGIMFAVAGAVVGTALALAASRWVQPLLFEQSARDPMVLLTVAALLVGVALLASAMPALRALRADPSTVLRAD